MLSCLEVLKLPDLLPDAQFTALTALPLLSQLKKCMHCIWFRFCSTDFLFDEVVISGPSHFHSSLPRRKVCPNFLRHAATRLENLTLRGISSLSVKSLSRLMNLRHLKLRSVDFDDRPDLASILTNFASLEKLTLSHQINEKEAIAIGSLTNLTSLVILSQYGDCSMERRSDCAYLFALTRLNRLGIYAVAVTDDEMNAFSRFKLLTSL